MMDPELSKVQKLTFSNPAETLYSDAVDFAHSDRKAIYTYADDQDVTVTVQYDMDFSDAEGTWLDVQTMSGSTSQAGKIAPIVFEDPVKRVRIKATSGATPPTGGLVIWFVRQRY